MSLLPAPEIPTTEGEININSVAKLQHFVLFVCYNLFSFIIIMRFISAPVLTTTDGKINVNGFFFLNYSGLVYFYVLIFSN